MLDDPANGEREAGVQTDGDDEKQHRTAIAPRSGELLSKEEKSDRPKQQEQEAQQRDSIGQCPGREVVESESEEAAQFL